MFNGSSNGTSSISRRRSMDGTTWPVPGGPVYGLDVTTSWFKSGTVRCPDPHYNGTTGLMTLFFSAQDASGNWGIGRARSIDNGEHWTVDAAAIVPPSTSSDHYAFMPSAVQVNEDYDQDFLLAYAWVCKINTLYQESTIEVHSYDDVTGLDTIPRGVVRTGNNNTFDDGSANRPRLVLDPSYGVGTNRTIHMFYSAYEWDHNAAPPIPTRACARIGYAISTANGASWVKKCPVFEPRMPPLGTPPVAWDWNSVVKPSLVVEPGQKLRLYYEGGAGQGNPVGLGVAEATWPFTEPYCDQGIMIALEQQPAPVDEGSIARLTSAPNPTRGTTTIEVDFSRAQVAGEAELTIIDVTGRLVRNLWTGSSLSAPSSIEWDGRESSGKRVAPGRYLARMRLGDTTAGSHWITVTR